MLALVAASEAGCWSSTSEIGTKPATQPPAPWDSNLGGCDTTFAQLRASLAVDHVERRRDKLAEQQAGETCATAVDKQACRDKLAAVAPPTSTLWLGCGNCAPSVTSLVATRGDDVIVVTSHEQLLALFGTIDTAVEARVIAEASNYAIACASWARPIADGFELVGTRQINDCPMQEADVIVAVSRDGSLREVSRTPRKETGGCAGRRPIGLEPGVASGTSEVGRYFASIAHLEAASVLAFEALGRALAVHHAPPQLLAAIARARVDEIAHARMMTTLARRFGGVVATPRVAARSIPSLRELALDNAREGCVRETWGALEAMWQSRHASDPGVRATLRRIAKDETQHALLSWQLAAWIDAQLSPRDRRTVRAARTTALHELRAELARPRSPALIALAGLPDRTATRALFETTRAQLWQ